MKLSTLTPPLESLHASSDDILLVSLISHDGLPVVHVGEGLDFDDQSALFFEMKKTCDRVLQSLKLGHSEEVFIRCREGCISIWPVNDMVFACMAKPSINSQRMQMLVWKTVSRLSGLV
ncbi:roadblock/LC7 domain-containing protein [Alcanivorax sp.]|jgi:predicted regulator of Ras-like GTPase activity (Roadblock/LC7/MglB family)|uniref:roadblock/LC7 domain-containing protein n=1 Tax=Alcanivorax sp. TaxID=1872427 RepID=UPI0032D90B0D